jgi:hypothetical protein
VRLNIGEINLERLRRRELMKYQGENSRKKDK